MLQVSESIQAVAGRVGPSVVGLGRGWGRGSGVVVADNVVLTNAHVLRGPDAAIRVGVGVVHGRVIGADRRADIAVIEADTAGAPAVGWEPARVASLRIGSPVLALADPGGRGLRVTAGHVSAAPGRAIEHTAPLPTGSSGGPLVDPDGFLLGLNTVRLEGGLILALPADAGLHARVKALAQGEPATRPRLGVALTRSLVVRGVQDASPAAVAGLAPGDRLLAAADRPLRGVDDLFDALAAGHGEVTLTVERGGVQRDLAVVLQ